MKKGIIALLICGMLTAPVFATDYTSPETIKQVQEALNAAGYNCGAPDGIAGSGTKGQIEKYRADKGLSAGNEIDDELYSSLFATTDSRTKEEIREDLKEKHGLIFSGDVRNDVTGNWRYALCASSSPVEDFALDYYKAYFENDKEVHGIINFTTKTTTAITVTTIGHKYLHVRVLEYVDGEEHNAKTLFSGSMLKTMDIDVETGAIEIIEETDNTSTDDYYYSAFIDIAKPILEESYGDHFQITEDGKLLMISIWGDGIAQGTVSAMAGNAQSIAEYKQLRSVMQEIAATFTERLQSAYSDSHLLFSVLNDVNTENVIMSFYDGEVYADALS